MGPSIQFRERSAECDSTDGRGQSNKDLSWLYRRLPEAIPLC